MNRNQRNLRRLSVAGLLAVPIIVSGCGAFGGKQSEAIDPPPAQVEKQMLNTAGSTAVQGDIGAQATVFLTDAKGMLAPVTLGIPKVDGANGLKESLEVLVDGGRYAGYVPQGFKGVLPAGTQINDVTLDAENKLAVVEFNTSFTQYQAADERKILEALTWTLTGHDGVEQVQVWVDGAKLNEMPVNHTPLDRSLTRAMGINLQKADDAVYTASSPVTVYFSAMTTGGIQYYVPVTRLVPTGQEAVQAALNELIRGPQYGDGLVEVIPDDTVVTSIETDEDGAVTVSLQDSMFQQGDQIPLELLQAVVLTVSENANDAKVKIRMNDLAEVMGSDSRNYSEPVSRPEIINEISI
ncbi:spore germination protein GerM [Paenibacillus sp. JCM 10914]|uniref:GerMN domain-containing protein n=1 Tax=Paenibacillus sp. JCM 10914 TaxID=1236974 RepID=UPI0003CC38C7|nr:GerMN domain-containing protein [Paenibacillus sp. JCM 10914]GAE07570.1 Na(+) H(+) antiporter subunit E [Paenibacillus sp. JCM 10914]